MSRRSLLGLPDNPPRFRDVLVTESGANCADQRSGSWFGRMAEQSPLTHWIYQTRWIYQIYQTRPTQASGRTTLESRSLVRLIGRNGVAPLCFFLYFIRSLASRSRALLVHVLFLSFLSPCATCRSHREVQGHRLASMIKCAFFQKKERKTIWTTLPCR